MIGVQVGAEFFAKRIELLYLRNARNFAPVTFDRPVDGAAWATERAKVPDASVYPDRRVSDLVAAEVRISDDPTAIVDAVRKTRAAAKCRERDQVVVDHASEGRVAEAG